MMITVGILSSFEARGHIGPVFQENDLGIPPCLAKAICLAPEVSEPHFLFWLLLRPSHIDI
jgi:hypothetical protein